MPKQHNQQSDMNFRESIGGFSGPRRDQRFQISLGVALLTHLMIIVVLPLAMGRGCQEEESYGVPEGTGLQQAQIIEIKKIKKDDRFILNMNSPICYYVPELDDSRLEEVDKETSDQYKAKLKSGLGKGGPGKGGWPGGMKNARVRFIRLEYSGGDWDQDMGADADYNLLLKFKERLMRVYKI